MSVDPAAAQGLLAGAPEPTRSASGGPADALAAEGVRSRLGSWCGWVMVGAAVLIPLIGWLSPLGFAPLVALMGLLCLPAFRIKAKDRPIVITLGVAIAWAAASLLWGAFKSTGAGHSVLMEVSLALPLYWSAICGARRADPRLNALALRILSVGLAAHAALLLIDVYLGAELFRTLHQAFYEPILPILAKLKLAQTTYVLAALGAVVLLGALRNWRSLALLGLVVLCVMIAADAFFAAAPLLAVPFSGAVFLIVRRWPRGGPRWLAIGVAATSFAMPWVVLGVRDSGQYDWIERILPDSWSARMSYWSHALDHILARPWLGWGLDASRHMGPGIVLHPHNEALQIWLELGLPGAAAVAVLWFLAFRRLEREAPSAPAAAAAAAGVAFVLFAWANFGIWQQWWLAFGALLVVLAAMVESRASIARA
jgi:O-antigen ligase